MRANYPEREEWSSQQPRVSPGPTLLLIGVAAHEAPATQTRGKMVSPAAALQYACVIYEKENLLCMVPDRIKISQLVHTITKSRGGHLSRGPNVFLVTRCHPN